MTGKTNIEWTEQSWNPIVGCSIVSPGCTNCYAMKMAHRLQAMADKPRWTKTGVGTAHYAGTTKVVNGKAVWTGKLALAPEHVLTAPLRRKKPTTYFVNSMGDLFHEDCSDEWIDKVFAVMALTPQHTFQVLTKRAARMRDWVSLPVQNWYDGRAFRVLQASRSISPAHDGCPRWPLPNVWLGVSCEDQQRYDERKEHLRETPAAVRFFSFEPLLGLISADYLGDWAICGGESGPGARPMHPDWARALRDQCAAAGTAFFFKQWGEWAPSAANMGKGDGLVAKVGKKAAGRLLDGVEHNGFPSVHGEAV